MRRLVVEIFIILNLDDQQQSRTVYFIRKGSDTVSCCKAVALDEETRKNIILAKDF